MRVMKNSFEGVVRCLLMGAFCLGMLSANGAEADVEGRPYEFVWANRVADDRPVLLPLTDAEGWTVDCRNAVARFEQTTEHRLFGPGVARLVYRATGKSPLITLRPPAPVAITGAFDTVSLWIYGNNVSYTHDKSTPPVTVTAQFADAKGRAFSLSLQTVHHLEWFLVQKRLPADLRDRAAAGGCSFTGFTVTGGTNEKDRQIELTSFAAYREDLKPLAFAARPKRPNRVFPDAPAGVNTGAGELSFPNRALGVVPQPVATDVEFRLPSSNVDWDDLAVRVKGGAWCRFAEGAGVYSVTTQGPRRVMRADVKVRWHVEGQSLVADIQGPADIAEVRFGALADFPAAKLFTVPYLSYSMTGAVNRPWLAVLDFAGTPYFCSATMDWTQSNATAPWCEAMRFDGLPSVHGGVRYEAKTDGTRNPCFERFVWSFAPQMADVLPVIPNPPSPHRNLTAEYQWCHMGAQKNRQKDKDYWRNRRRRGLAKVFIGDHEVCMRDGNESFTFRTKAAPGKGGDEGMRDFTRYMIDDLGYLYGPYNNYTDFAPVNEYWHADHMTRQANGDLLPAWNRCYAPKPTWSVEMCEKIVPVLQEKFRFNSGYCDVHTCVSPWGRCDYDARVPGGGTFAGTFYAYGELLQLQRKFWTGPVYSEGGVHFLYCGLDDGNFAQDQGYGLDQNPWIVDFDLLRMHPLANNFGMGYPRMFYSDPNFVKTPHWQDRFLAATLAFGHVGYFMTGRPDDEEFGYWMVQPLQCHYAKADVATIAYADAKGNLLPSAQGLASGACQRSQVAVAYKDGTRVFANGSAEGEGWLLERNGMRFAIPANGWLGMSGDGSVISISALTRTTNSAPVRVDACVSSESVYVNGRGHFFDSAFGATDGCLIRLREGDGTEEVFVRHTREVLLPYAASKIVMRSEKGDEIGSAAFTVEGSRTRLVVSPKAFSHRVTYAADVPFAPRRDSLLKAFAMPQTWKFPKLPTKHVPFTLPRLSVTGMAYRGQPETPITPESGAVVGRPHEPVAGEVKKGSIFMHPPYRGGTGYTFQRWRLDLPKEPLVFTASVGKIDRSSRGDGTLYRILVEDAEGRRTVLAELQTNEHRWSKLTADLSPWAGRTVFLMLVADAGPANNTEADHSTWADLEFRPRN